MQFDDDKLKRIYDKTSGYCHICKKKLSWNNYASPGRKGNWEVEHSIPKVKGGTDHLNNLYAACIVCNREKQARTTRTARRKHGRRRAPLSRKKRAKAKLNNAILGGALGGLAGAILGPWGVAVGAAAGAKIGHDQDPDKE